MDLFIALLLIFSVIVSLFETSSAVQCYVCSWSLKDEDNRTDWCTGDNFEPKVVYIHECEYGCETIMYWDKNDVLEHWRRNCVQKETIFRDTCVEDEDRARRWKHCTCSSNYCNSAISWTSSLSSIRIASLCTLLSAISYLFR